MPTQILNWKLVRDKTVQGSDIEIGWPASFDREYRGTLLSEILSMPRKTPISLEKAAQMASAKMQEAFDACRLTHAPGHYQWYECHFVDWISSLGYHIEITGDEFDAVYPSAFDI